MKYILTSSERKKAKGKKGKDLENIFLEYWERAKVRLTEEK